MNDSLIKPEVQRLISRYNDLGEQLTLEEYKALFLNSYERAALYPIMDNNCLLTVSRQHLMQASVPVYPTTYNEVVVALLTPLLLDRLYKEHTANKKLAELVKAQTLPKPTTVK